MPIKESTEEGVPSTWVPGALYDFRAMPDGPRGYKVGITKKGHLGSKRKLEAYAEQVRCGEIRCSIGIASACATDDTSTTGMRERSPETLPRA